MRLLAAVIFLLIGAPAFADPFGRASIEGDGAIAPGQQVHVAVEVFAPDFFTSPPQFPLFEVPDALITLSNDRAQNLTETIDGTQYSGIRKSYAVVPEKAGSFALPAINIDIGYSSNGVPMKTTVKVELPPFSVAAPSERAATPFAARNLTIAQSFDRDPASLKVGDALVRTIVVSAEDTQAMLMPPVEIGRPSGATPYLKPPVLADGVERGGMGRSSGTGSTRTETVIYTVSSEGTLSIPPVAYPWIDVDGHSLAIANLPAIDVVVAAPEAATERIQPQLEHDGSAGGLWRGWILVLLLCLVDLVVGIFVWRRSSTIRTLAVRLREQRRNSPRRRLGRVRSVVREGDEFAIYRALQDWSRKLGYTTLSEWSKAQADPRLSNQIAILERRLFRSQDGQLDRASLASAIILPAARARHAGQALPELNPSA